VVGLLRSVSVSSGATTAAPTANPARRHLTQRSLQRASGDGNTVARSPNRLTRSAPEFARGYVRPRRRRQADRAATKPTPPFRLRSGSRAVEQAPGTLHLSICDDGVGGADPARGSGLIGLQNRVEAIGGTIAVGTPAKTGQQRNGRLRAFRESVHLTGDRARACESPPFGCRNAQYSQAPGRLACACAPRLSCWSY
jgi:hypothetical protein